MSFYEVARVILRGVMPLFFRLNVTGLEGVPNRGLIVCPNHVSYLDPVLVAMYLPQQLTFMGKDELFHIPLLSRLFRALGGFPIKRGKADTAAIQTAVDYLEAGRALMIFPEGTRSFSGKLLKFHSGAALIAAKTDADLLPVAIETAGRTRLFKRITIHFGTVIENPFRGLSKDQVSSLILRDLTRALRAGVLEMLPTQAAREAAEKEAKRLGASEEATAGAGGLPPHTS